MTGSVTEARWRAAVAAERDYWAAVAHDPREFARIVSEKVDVAEWFESERGGGAPSGDWAEIGIGQYGVGCMHFLAGADSRALVGIEPLPQLTPDRLQLVAPLVAVVEACRALPYRQIEASGEASGLDAAAFGLVCCYNVLDQVREPSAVLKEAYRLLRPGGWLLLGCNTTSTLSRVRHAIDRRPKSLGLTAHTFRFSASDVVRLTNRVGFDVERTRLRGGAWSSFGGRSERLLLAATKTDGGRS